MDAGVAAIGRAFLCTCVREMHRGVEEVMNRGAIVGPFAAVRTPRADVVACHKDGSLVVCDTLAPVRHI